MHDVEGFQICLVTTIERIQLSSQGRNKLEAAIENGEFVARLHLKAPT
jgi:hypothetical protein